MRRLIKWAIFLGIIGLIVWGASVQVAYWQERQRITYRETEIVRGTVVAVVNSTGTVKPVQTVTVGSVVSGPIIDIPVGIDHNAEVKKGQLLARVDPQIYKAAVARDKAALATRKAEVEHARAKLKQAKNDEMRAKALRAENKNFLSDTELDQFVFNRMALDALLSVAETNVEQAQANLDSSLTNLEYTLIKSPVDGIIIDRKIDPGQTMAAQFQTPELFIVAPDLRKEMHVFASVDETDIGRISEAQKEGQPVRFTVDAYPDDLFEGTIFQVRQNATTTQNVVTYPVVVSTTNTEGKLRPGMTASVSFQVGKVTNVLKIPNAALRFYPPAKQVRAEDRKILEGKTPTTNESDESKETVRSAEEKAEIRRKRNRRHVWVVEGEFLRAVEVITGLSDSQYTELVGRELQEGQKVVTGVQARE